MLIRELAERTGLATHTIRFYEKEGLLDGRFIERGENNYRHYSPIAVERLMMIQQGQSVGFTLSEIKELMQAWDAGTLTPHEQALHIEQKLSTVNTRIAELEKLRNYLADKLDYLHMGLETETKTG